MNKQLNDVEIPVKVHNHIWYLVPVFPRGTTIPNPKCLGRLGMALKRIERINNINSKETNEIEKYL